MHAPRGGTYLSIAHTLLLPEPTHNVRPHALTSHQQSGVITKTDKNTLKPKENSETNLCFVVFRSGQSKLFWRAQSADTQNWIEIYNFFLKISINLYGTDESLLP